MPGKFEIYKTKKGDYRFRLKAANGECILTSQNYKSKAGAKNGVESVRKNAGSKGRFEVRKAKNGKDYFVLKAGNHQVIGTSEMYNSGSSCSNGMKSVGKNAKAKVEDIS
ncbi:MAG: YegP family protein [Pseudomonadota bacterium]